jgi:hypothetical protein
LIHLQPPPYHPRPRARRPRPRRSCWRSIDFGGVGRRLARAPAGSSSAAAGACSGGVSRAGRALRGRAAQGAQLGQLGARERARGPWGGSLAAFRSRSQRSDASAAESYVLYESTCSVCCVWHVTWPMVKPTTAVRRICMDLLTVCFAIVCALRALSPARVENSDS